jgi:hypothetical protein
MHLRTALLLLTLTALVPISSEENFRSNSGLSTGEKGELGEDVCNALSTGDNERRRCLLATSRLQGKRCCFLTLTVFSLSSVCLYVFLSFCLSACLPACLLACLSPPPSYSFTNSFSDCVHPSSSSLSLSTSPPSLSRIPPHFTSFPPSASPHISATASPRHWQGTPTDCPDHSLVTQSYSDACWTPAIQRRRGGGSSASHTAASATCSPHYSAAMVSQQACPSTPEPPTLILTHTRPSLNHR